MAHLRAAIVATGQQQGTNSAVWAALQKIQTGQKPCINQVSNEIGSNSKVTMAMAKADMLSDMGIREPVYCPGVADEFGSNSGLGMVTLYP